MPDGPVLVTGGAGYIGSHTVRRLTEAGVPVVVLDNLSTGYRWAVPEAATFVEADVGDREAVTQIISRHGVKAVVHFAGSIVVPESVAEPLGYEASRPHFLARHFRAEDCRATN